LTRPRARRFTIITSQGIGGGVDALKAVLACRWGLSHRPDVKVAGLKSGIDNSHLVRLRPDTIGAEGQLVPVAAAVNGPDRARVEELFLQFQTWQSSVVYPETAIGHAFGNDEKRAVDIRNQQFDGIIGDELDGYPRNI
jgi:hypothetical protein